MVFPPCWCCCAEHHVSADRSLTFEASKKAFVVHVISVKKKYPDEKKKTTTQNRQSKQIKKWKVSGI